MVWLAMDDVHPPLVRRMDLGRDGPENRVAGGLTGLRVIEVRDCDSLADDWLPESSQPQGLKITR